MSRHRDEARFYVTRADLDLDRDIAPMPDAVVPGVQRLMTRSHAKDLAIDSLRDADKEQLTQERNTLREQFRDGPPPEPKPWLDHDVDRAAAALDSAHERRAMLQEHREALPWHRRRERAELDRLLERTIREIEHRTEAHHSALIERNTSADVELGWLQTHGPDADRLLAVDHELRAREHIDGQVVSSIERLQSEPAPLYRGFEPPMPDPGRELGIDL